MKIFKLFVAFTLICFALLPAAHAVVPAPDGGYPGFNTAEGQNAFFGLTTGVANTAVGWYSLWSNTDGSYNTAVGAGTLVLNVGDQTTGDGTQNTAIGAGALLSNSTGLRNTAIGAFTLLNNIGGDFGDGSNNTAIGVSALFNNTTGCCNIGIGFNALLENTEGLNNVANGNGALELNTTGFQNTGIGGGALQFNLIGNNNTALGHRAGFDITGDGNVCIGQGVDGEAGVDNTTYIRNVNTLLQNFSAGVNDYVTVRLSDGRLGHTAVVSSRRYKEDIKPLAAASEALYALNPVSFRLKKEYDESQLLGFGLIAEEVEKVDPALVYRNNKGQVESVRYEMVNAMLLNEFLKEHKAFSEEQRKVEEQQATITQLKKDFGATIAQLTARLDEQAAQIQKVSAQLEASKPAPQLVNNP